MNTQSGYGGELTTKSDEEIGCRAAQEGSRSPVDKGFSYKSPQRGFAGLANGVTVVHARKTAGLMSPKHQRLQDSDAFVHFS